jgi:nitrile hydratase accessory protein
LDSAALHDAVLPQAVDWKTRALGVALALARDGHFEWEDFRQALLQQLGPYQSASEASWQFCRKWLRALESVVGTAGLVDAGALAELRALAERAQAGADAQALDAARPATLHLV